MRVNMENNSELVDLTWNDPERNKSEIKLKNASNIKSSRPAVSEETVKAYFPNLIKTIEGVAPNAIINYDETNLADNPGQRKFLFKRKTKYPERIINYFKGCTSIMMAGTASGVVFPPYAIYKAQNLWTSWIENGPLGARYNTSKSGWSYATCFADWFFTVIVPYCKKLDAEAGKCEPKVLIGDNLSSHFSTQVLKSCKERTIRFCFLPKNSTHLTQPLDVVFFRPMKSVWEHILTEYKMKHSAQTTASKSKFPKLLPALYDEMKVTASQNLQTGFATYGIFPFAPNKVLSKMPASKSTSSEALITNTAVGQSVLAHLKKNRYREGKRSPKKRKRIDLRTGKSVTFEELPEKKITISKQKKKSHKPKRAKKRKAISFESDTNMSLRDDTDFSFEWDNDKLDYSIQSKVTSKETNCTLNIDDIVSIRSGKYMGQYAKILGSTPCADDEFKINYLKKICVAGTRHTSTFYYVARLYDLDSRPSDELQKLSSNEYYMEGEKYYIYM